MTDRAAGDPVEQAVCDYLEALRRGDAPDIPVFAARYPKQRAELEALLPLIAVLENAGKSFADRSRDICALPMPLGSDLLLTERIGSGGMGTVYKARQTSLNRLCAVKLLNFSLAAKAEERNRFMREARMIARLHHPNIVSVYSTGNDNGCFYYVMDLITGPSLHSLAASPEAVARIGLQAANALAYAHSCGIVHCDIKPSNLLAEADGTVRLSDFGLSRLLGDPEGDSGGTLRYMSPERLRREPFSEAADQYALGITLRELLSGAPLPVGQSPSETRKAILRGELPPLPRSCPTDLAAILNRMTAAVPERRYAAMPYAAADLKCFLEHRPVRARSTSVPRRLLLWARRRPATAAACGTALLCALLAVTSLAIGYRNTERERRIAESNAALADRTLSRVFRHIDNDRASRANTFLLRDLLPYYTGIARQRGRSEADVCNAYRIIASAALRSGRYAAANEACRSLYTRAPSARSGNDFAKTLTLLGRTRQAREIGRQVIDSYRDTKDPQERLAAIEVLLRLGKDSFTPADRDLLLKLIRSFRESIPLSPDMTIRLVNALCRIPELLEDGNARYSFTRESGISVEKIYRMLIRVHPGHRQCGVSLLGYTTDRLRKATAEKTEIPQDLILLAQNTADRLLGLHFGNTEVSSAALRFWIAYADYLRRLGEKDGFRSFSDRMYGVLDILFYNSETPNEAREFLLERMLERLETACRTGNKADIARLREQVTERFRYYHGEARSRLTKKFERILASQSKKTTVPAAVKPETDRPAAKAAAAKVPSAENSAGFSQ